MSGWARTSSCGTEYCLAGWYVHRHRPRDLTLERNSSTGVIKNGCATSLENLAVHFDIPYGLASALFVELGDYDSVIYYRDRQLFATRLLKQLALLEERAKDKPVSHRHGSRPDEDHELVYIPVPHAANGSDES